MLETLSRGFRNAKARLTGVAELTPDNIEDALRDVRMSLLEADVEFKVTKTFLDRVKEKALGETVKLRAKAGDQRAVGDAGAALHPHLPGRAHRADGARSTPTSTGPRRGRRRS